ncbi:MAG: methionine--tRNA ligase subunit beta [Phycisphaerales bacterium]|nr:methionine--tRNA ligase subunit beta [Phycisphaerales bacterium]
MADKPTISFEDFVKVDLRIAKITAAEHHPNADKLLIMQVDDGSGEPRQLCAGIRPYYDPADLVGKSIVIVANLEPRKIRGEMSRGMLLAASSPPGADNDERSIILLTPMGGAEPGSPVS